LHASNGVITGDLKIKNKLSQPIASMINAVQSPIMDQVYYENNSFLKNIGAISSLGMADQDSQQFYQPHHIIPTKNQI
jgi:hypothetical protein